MVISPILCPPLPSDFTPCNGSYIFTRLTIITCNPTICHGKPVIRNTRVLVSNILADLAVGSTPVQIIADYSGSNEEDIKAALEFGSELANFKSIPYEAAV